MEIVSQFSVAASEDRAWECLLDIPLVVDCLPGATLTEAINDVSYKGKIRVRLGPIAMEFAGVLALDITDSANHVATIRAEWNETRNRGSATSVSRLAVRSVAGSDHCDVDVQTQVSLAGQVAQYGRGVGIIQAVSAELVRQFAQNLQAALESPAAGSQLPASDSAPTNGQGPHPPETSRQPIASAAVKEISTLSLLWNLFRSKVRALFAHP